MDAYYLVFPDSADGNKLKFTGDMSSWSGGYGSDISRPVPSLDANEWEQKAKDSYHGQPTFRNWNQVDASEKFASEAIFNSNVVP
jgi:hypothetical protein